jgi:hypothetical protein
MPSKTLQRRNINYVYLFTQAAIVLIIIYSIYLAGSEYYILLGISIYFLFSIYLKILIPKWHRNGMNFMKKEKYDLAILSFQRSYEYFTKHTWIDHYRAFTLFSTSRDSYAEMALINIINCFRQLGDVKMARKYLQILQEKFPENKFS